jgi:serine/threonine-protein kinase
VRFCNTCLSVFRTDFQRCPMDGSELVVASTDPLIGQTLADRYVVEGLIGEGAMARVYRAHHRTLANQRYAVKVLIGDLAASSTMRQRFAREAANASKLDHPNVVNVIDYGRTEQGLSYLVMDLVEGVPLGKLVQQGPIAADRAIRIAHQLAEGLDHAHERGVIHRDFKSDNILIVGEPGREIARIADFGLAMSTSNDVRLTTSGVACTPAYAAPEQLRGQPFDHRVDLYGLGATLFEMLSGGYLPFEGDMDATVRAKLTHEAPSIVTRAPNVPPGLVTLVARLLAYDPEERPKSARAVIRALETSMTLPRPPIRTVEIAPVAEKKRSRRRKITTFVFVGTLVGLAGIVRHEKSGAMPEVAVASASAAPVSDEQVTPTTVAPSYDAIGQLEVVLDQLRLALIDRQ